MKINLYISFYQDKNPARQKELGTCFLNNCRAGFDEIWCLVEQNDAEYYNQFLISLKPITQIIHVKYFNQRPTLNDYIEISNTYPDNTIHLVQNSDIYTDQFNLNKIKSLNWNNKLFLGLSRWDVTEMGNKILLDRADSADTWVWKGKITENINVPCPCGFAGIDNRVAWEFHNAGYNVVNPSRDIITNHLHLIRGNSYRIDLFGDVRGDMICPEPYYFHKPIWISEM